MPLYSLLFTNSHKNDKHEGCDNDVIMVMTVAMMLMTTILMLFIKYHSFIKIITIAYISALMWTSKISVTGFYNQQNAQISL